MADCDVLIIGAGHNALVCGGYLAKAGYQVLMLERRPVVGGAVVTEEHVPGFKFDLGGSAHILINHTPVVADLNLTQYGLDYIDLDPLFFAPFPDGTSITMWKDLDKTCESIAAVCPEDADNYRNFITKWTPMAEAMVQSFMSPPTPANLVRHLGIGSKMGKQAPDRISDIVRGYGHILRTTFKSPKVQALIGWMAAQSGPPPTEPLSAPFALWHPMYHVSGMRRPRGGSGMLTQALKNMILAHGGQIFTDSPVQRILSENGRATGAETTDGRRYTARKAVVSGAHVHTTTDMLEDRLPQKDKEKLKNTRIGNGFGMVVRYAVHELPNYTAMPSPEDGSPGPNHTALQFICPDLEYLERAYGDYMGGTPSRDPALIIMTFSAVDPTLAPEGKHTMFTWGQYYPYELANGEHWDDIAQREADKMLDTLSQYAPNAKDIIIDGLIETPLYLERTLGLLRGNVMHLEMSFDQMLALRPTLSMNTYRGPVKGLYLTGASTHPGGGIMGASGRNAAHVLMRDLNGRKWFGF